MTSTSTSRGTAKRSIGPKPKKCRARQYGWSEYDVRQLYDLIIRVAGVTNPPKLVVQDDMPGSIYGNHSPGVITISLRKHENKPFSYMVDTLLHELAHEIAATEGHDDEWQRVARRLGAVPTYRGLRL